MPNVAFRTHKKRGGRLRTGHREAATGLPAATSPSEAHKKRGGRLRTRHKKATTGLPAAERLLKAAQNA